MRFDRDDFGSVEDSGRGRGGGFRGGGFGGGGGMILGLIASRFGIGGVVVVVLLMVVFGGFGSMFGGGSGVVGSGGSGEMKTGAQACGQSDIHRFSCNVHGSTDRVWTELFAQAGQTYRPPVLRFFEQSVQSGCGAAQSAMGPFYCPSDQRIYIDLTFFDELAQRFGAAGDFAGAYVIAHEVGHHIQTITGTSDTIRRAQSGARERDVNALQVRMELQADCYAGVWAANVARSGDQLDANDMAEGLRAAEAIGDDTLQKAAGRRPVPESFTHGTSDQRQEALRRGFEGGTPAACAAYTQGI